MDEVETVISAVENGENWYGEEEVEFLMTEGSKNSAPKVRKIGANIQKIFNEHKSFSGKFRYDSFRGEFETSFNNNKWEPFEDHILRTVISKVQVLYPHFDTGCEKMIRDYAILASMQNSISPPLQYIEAIEWDGVPRLKEWLHKVYHVDNNDYYSEIGTRWLKYLVKRLKYPGSQFDHVLVFKGGQGFGKSSALRMLCNFNENIYFDESEMSPDSGKDFAISLRNNIVYEFAEGAIAGYQNQKKVKSFITKPADKYRPPYMKSNEDFPRQNVFAMSTNDPEFLSDKTGERRYWVVEIPDEDGLHANIEWIEENRDQLFAEAYTMIDEPWLNLTPEVTKVMETIISGHKELDPVEDFVLDWYDSLDLVTKKEGIKMKDIKASIKGDDDMREFWTKYLDRDISRILRDVLKLDLRVKKTGNTSGRIYVPSEKTKLTNGTSVPNELDKLW